MTASIANLPRSSNLSPSISLFLTDVGVDIVLSKGDERTRTRIAYDTLKGTLTGEPVELVIGDDDQFIDMHMGERTLRLELQPKGHYFSWLNPLPAKGKPVSIAEARKLAGLITRPTGNNPDGTLPF